jgi:hypothetical protein
VRGNIRKHAITEIRRSTAVIMERWKMSVYPRSGAGALFDREEDPEECTTVTKIQLTRRSAKSSRRS